MRPLTALVAHSLAQGCHLGPNTEPSPKRGCGGSGTRPRPPTSPLCRHQAPEEPYPLWAAPTAAQLKRHLSASLFSAADAGRPTLLAEDARGATSCDLLAALVQLLLGAPFAPASSGAEVLLDVVDELRGAVANAAGDAEVASGEPAADGLLCWRAVARLPLRTLCTALGAVEAHVYEAEAEALAAWVQGRGAALHALLAALEGASLAWLRPLGTEEAMAALLSLPGVRQAEAAALLLLELHRPLLPVCLNLLPELKALGWVPPSASTDAAFLHMRCRLPSDARLAYALHSALRQSNCLRLHRHATSGVSAIPEAAPAEAAPPDESVTEESPEAEAAEAAEEVEEVEEVEADIVPVEERSRRRVLTLTLTLRSLPSQPDAAAIAAAAGAAVGAAAAAATAAAGRQASPEAMQEAKAAREAAMAAAAAAVETVEVVADERGVSLSGSLLRCVQEAAAWHTLYPECGSTPALVTLRATDPAAAAACAAAVRAGALPLQTEAGLRYAVEAHWGAREALRCAALLGATREAEAEAAEAEAERVEEGAGGAWLFGFGPQLECGLHLVAKANRPEALATLWRRAIGSGMPPLDLRGRGALHAAAHAGALASIERLLELRADPTVADSAGDTPLHAAAAANRPRCCAVLLEADAAGSRKGNRAGSHPLELAAEAGAMHACRVLLENRADVDAQSRRGRAALHAATRGGHLAVSRLLVEAGCKLTLLDLSERRADEMIPERLHAQGKWLVDATRTELEREKAARRAAGKHCSVGVKYGLS